MKEKIEVNCTTIKNFYSFKKKNHTQNEKTSQRPGEDNTHNWQRSHVQNL